MKIIQEIKQYNLKEWFLLVIIVVAVLWLGLLSVNEFLEYRYKAIFLSTPCELCLRENSHLDLVQKPTDPPFRINFSELFNTTEGGQK